MVEDLDLGPRRLGGTGNTDFIFTFCIQSSVTLGSNLELSDICPRDKHDFHWITADTDAKAMALLLQFSPSSKTANPAPPTLEMGQTSAV